MTTSTKRRESAKVRRDAEGNKLCSCGCGQIPVRPRINWHSQACVDAWKAINDPETIRRAILERDQGICAKCGVDCNKAYGEWRRAMSEASKLIGRLEYIDRFQMEWNDRTGCMAFRQPPHLTVKEHRRRITELRAKWNPPGNWTAGRSSGWDADHIVPVIEGGGLCGLENYRTLCHPCHKAATKALAGRRAEQRAKPEKDAPTLFVLPEVSKNTA